MTKKNNSTVLEVEELVEAVKKVEKTIGISQEGYFLYEDSNIIKETFISDPEKRVSLIGSTSYFDKINSDSKVRLMTSKNKLEFEIRENTQLNEIILQLSPTFANKKIKLKKNDINNFGILIIPKHESVGEKRKMVEIVDTLLVKALQSYDKYLTLNPIDLSFRSNYLNDKFIDYKGYTYRLTLKNILFSANITNETQNIFVTCHNLNSEKKALINAKTYSILGIINLDEIKNWTTIKGESLYVNAKPTGRHYPDRGDHLAFSLKTTYPNELLEFTCELLDHKSKQIKFAEEEQKVPIFDFQIDILK